MGLNDDVFKHYEIDDGSIEKLLEIWKYYFPKDDPDFSDKNKIFLNKKYSEVNAYQIMFVLAGKVLNMYWLDRFYTQGFHLRTREPIDILYDKFLKIKNPEEKIKKELFSEIETEKVIIKKINKKK
jgi:hypothetical protein